MLWINYFKNYTKIRCMTIKDKWNAEVELHRNILEFGREGFPNKMLYARWKKYIQISSNAKQQFFTTDYARNCSAIGIPTKVNCILFLWQIRYPRYCYKTKRNNDDFFRLSCLPSIVCIWQLLCQVRWFTRQECVADAGILLGVMLFILHDVLSVTGQQHCLY